MEHDSMKRLLIGTVAVLLSPLSLGDITTYTCTNGTGTFTAVIGTPTTTPPAGSAWGYYNGVYSWAGDFSYSATPNYADTAGGPLSGPADIAVTLTGPFGAWQPYMASSFSWPSTGYTKLTFALKPTVPGQQWSSQFVGVGDVALPS